ncbi:MAG TPA: GNAT family N-acetyltransferase [Candidatus Acidoferrum sp.]|jgi:GNAT superfamily N-acetyltransferase|nr:GNAT family N-acetyltransferase [Candidatus Acidoferrum sp.]
MIEVCDLTEKNVEDIATFCGRYKSNGSPSEAKNEFFMQGEERKKKVLLRKLKRGGRGKIAYKENKPVGFIEYYPIEDAPLNIVGKDIAIIPCMNVKFDERKKGIGGKLIRACIEDARNMRRKGVAVRATDWQDFMPRTFFEKYGFTNVTKSGPINILMIKYEEVENPRWLTLSYKQKPSDGKLIIDIFHNDQCPFDWQNSERVKKIASEFAERAEVNDFDTNKRENILKYGTLGAIIVNGEYLGVGPPLSEEDIRKTFQERLKTTSP